MSVLSQFGPPVPYAATAGSVTNGVYTVGNQTIGGVKTFTSTIVGDISGNAGTATTANFATSAGSVTDGVYTVGNQTIGGVKTFTSTIVGDISGNAGTVTGGVYTTGNQTIGGTKTFSSAIVGDVTGNAGTVTNGVYTTGNQTIGGTKTFSSTISGDISGNAGTVTNGVYTTGNQTIGGTKTFSANPILSAGTANTVLVLDSGKQIAAASGLGYNTTTRTLTLGVGDTPDFRVGRGAGNISSNTAVGANSLVANTTGTSNTVFGNNALSSNTTGSWNTAIGDGALYSNTDAGYSTAVGYNALYSGGGNGLGTNTAIGANSLRSLTTGYDNTAVGADSLRAATTGRWNVAIGERALRNNTTGTWNIAVGSDTLLNTSTGPANIAIGASALSANTTGSSNVAVGHNALIGNTTGAGNTSVGAYTQSITRTGSRNITIGYASGELITTGSNNSILGSFDGNQHGIDIRTASNNIVLSDGLGVPRAFYNAAAETWDFRTGAAPGTVRLTIGASGLSVSGLTASGVLSLAAGTALLPSLAATGDLDTGMWFPAANTVAWSTNGLERARLNSAGSLGVGTNSPRQRFEVAGGVCLNLPADIWTTSGMAADTNFNGGIFYTNGGFRASWACNGYRNSAGTWTSLSVNSQTGAAMIELDPAGLILFRTEASKATGSTFNIAESLRIDSTGAVGIGTTSLTGYNLRVTKNITGAASAFGITSDGTTQPDVTTHAQYFRTNTVTAANGGTPYTIAALTHYLAQQGTINADSSITTQIGFSATSSLTSGTNVYGFYGSVAAATGRWNFYAAGSAQNYFAGNVGIGTTSIDALLTVNGVAAFGAGSSALPSVARSGDLDTGMWFPAGNTVAWSTGGLEAMRITSTRNVVIGGTAAIGGKASVYGGLYMAADDHTAELQNYRASDNTGAAFSYLNKARGTIAAPTVVNSGDGLGSLIWRGYDGGAYAQAAIIRAEVDGTPGSGDMPGRLLFLTSADGTSTPTERMRIKSAGQVRFVPLAADPTVNVEDGDVYYNSVTNKLRVRAGGAWADLN